MLRRPYPGAWYADGLPSGEHVVLTPGQPLETHVGPVPLPPGEPWGPQFTKISPTKDRFAGHAHSANQTTALEYLFTARRWWARPTATGRIVYDPHGNILDTQPAGYGYFDTEKNEPVSRIETYQPFHGLNSWCKVGSLYIGQGHEGGVHVWDGAVLRVLDTGPCQEITAHEDGDAVTVSYRKDGFGCWIVDTTFAELRALPPVAVPPIVVPPVIPPEPSPMAIPDEEDFVRATADAHPELLARMRTSSHATDALRDRLGEDDPAVRAGEVATDALKGQLCRVIVWGLSRRNANWGLLRKDGGAGAVRPDGVRHATDVAFWKPDGKVVDILSDYDVGWANRDGDFQPADRWVAPLFEPDGEVSEPPPVDPPGGPIDLTPWLQRLANAEAGVQQAMRNVVILDGRLLAAEATIKKLEARPVGSPWNGGKLVITGITLDVDPESP